MATTGQVVTWFLNGVRTSAGAVVASGKARAYQPGTLVAQTVYSDSACSTPITQPLTLDAGGRYLYAYTLEPVRWIVKDSTDTTTIVDTDAVLRHDQVYITHTSVNSGAEITLENWITQIATSMGAGFQYQESAGATARNYVSVIGERRISVKDFGALGDDSNDDTAEIQAAIDRAAASGASRIVYFPRGTYKINGTLSITTAGIKLVGDGMGVSTIKQYATGSDTISVDYGASPVASGLEIRGLTISTNTTNSEEAIAIDNGKFWRIEDVEVTGHAKLLTVTAGATNACHGLLRRVFGTQSSAPGAAYVHLNGSSFRSDHITFEECHLSGDNSAVDLITDTCQGTRHIGCRYVGGASNTGVELVADGVIRDCKFSTFSTAVTNAASNTNGKVSGCAFATCTTGVTVASVGCSVTQCSFSGGTTDISLSGGVFVHEDGNFYTGASALHSSLRKAHTTSTTSTSATATWTIDFAVASGLVPTHHVLIVNVASGGTWTVAAPSNGSRIPDDTIVTLCMVKQQANNTTVSWNAVWQDVDGSTMNGAALTINTTTANYLTFRKSGSNYILMGATYNIGI